MMGDALQSKFAGRPPLPDAEASENYQIVLEQICHAERLRTLKSRALMLRKPHPRWRMRSSNCKLRADQVAAALFARQEARCRFGWASVITE